MTVKTIPLSISKITRHLENGHSDTLKQATHIQELLTKLRYEGRASFGRNVKEIRHAFIFFNLELSHHIQIEEDVIFPFLKIHIPKLESVIHLLEAEHADFGENLESFELSLKLLAKESADLNRGSLVEKIRQLGTYLIYLLTSHARAENQSVYQVLMKELKPQEKKELAEKLISRLKTSP